MNYREFLKQIDGGAASGAYLLHGEEEFFKENCLRMAEKLVAEEARFFDLAVLRDADPASIASACEKLPLMSPRSVVTVRGLASGADGAELAEYVLTIPETTLLVIAVRGKLEAKSKLLSALQKKGREVLVMPPSELEAAKWCVASAARRGASIDESTARTLVGLVGVDMLALNNELQKAIDLVGEGGVITAATVSLSAVNNIEYRVFEAIDCFTSGKAGDGMRALNALLREERDPSRTIGALLSSFRRMLEARRLMDGGMSPRMAASRMDGKSYANEKACSAAKKYTSERLASLIGTLALAVYEQRSGGEDAANAVEAAMLGFDW